ncbi:cilia- and flagella-associated protein 61 isoform X6 [Pteropus medius]|uniref:cilia- and flagella-associated protein 61 isoform X6 n=1 Tax=Pteropus vampyrus TaxID=132908 RepID=UPI00196A4A31|nr:cilia- and flagella-associated protein 61 isoform X6 [Pteropus giganteus]
MSILTSPRGKVEVVHCRRTESQDIYCIKNLIRKFTQKLFGRLNIIYLLEKANLAITLCNDKEEIMAQATFLDYPNWNVAKQDDWVSVFLELDNEIPCTVEGVAVGFMSVCSRVNMKLLHECFDLGLFHGLCIPHPDDVLEPPQELSVQGSQDAELRNSSQDSQKTVEEPLEHVSSEARKRESIQGKITEEAAIEELSSIVQSGNTSEIEDLENLGQESTEDDTNYYGSNVSSASISLSEETNYFRPIYMGASAAFCIQLFCIDEKHEARSLDFMNFVFSLFPDKNFCIISLPHLTPEFVLIQNFVKIVPFNNCTLEQDLYVFHRAGLLKTINIRLANLSDTPGVENLVSTLMLKTSILEDLKQYNEARRDPDGTPLQAFVADVAEQIVGIAVIRNEMDIEYIRSHYNIEDFIYFSHHQREEHGHLYHFALNPIFRHYTKFFLKEILRLGYKSCLYYPIYPEFRESKFQISYAHSLTSALHYLVPVRPRRQIVYPLEKLGINAPSKAVSKDLLSYALNHTNRKLTLEPKITVNARIVVVGASNVGISFLETLVFCSHLKFSNLTLISTHGLPGKKLLGTEQRKFLASDHCFNDKDHALMSLCSWVNVVVGRMTAIDRAAKHVVVSQEGIVLYDHLILCTGQQYQVPCPTGADISQHLTNKEIPKSSKQRYTGKVPCNHFILNDEEDCFKAVAWLRSNSIIIGGNVIVYGDTIDTYTTVEALLNLGVRGSYIHLVLPPPTSTITCINNYTVERAVERALQAAGVTVYREALLAQWNEGQNPDPIHSASFTTPTKPFKLPCSAFFSFSEKNVDYETFKAINDACLVYDGRLVIDTNFHTNDIAIRAAGSLTKFSNRYYSNEWTHSNFNSKEIGFQLAAAMLSLFDPTLEPVTEPPADLDRLIPMYKGAKIKGGILPGSYHYLHIAKPAIPTPLEVQMAQPDFGSEIVTGSAKNGTYFRIHINKYKMVEAITCLSKEAFPTSNYIRLFGQHEQVLNNLCARYEDRLITDLYRWCHCRMALNPRRLCWSVNCTGTSHVKCKTVGSYLQYYFKNANFSPNFIKNNAICKLSRASPPIPFPQLPLWSLSCLFLCTLGVYSKRMWVETPTVYKGKLLLLFS